MWSIIHTVVPVYCSLLPYRHIGAVTMSSAVDVCTNLYLQREGCSEIHYGAKHKNIARSD